MEEAWQFPCCWSAVDECHIPIKCLPPPPPPFWLESCKEYHNFINFFSVVLMGMVDSKYRFVWGSCRYPGNSHDLIIFKSTDLWIQIKNQGYLPKIGKDVGGPLVPPLILGDAAFPLQPCLMKPCTNANPTLQQRYYNYQLSWARNNQNGNKYAYNIVVEYFYLFSSLDLQLPTLCSSDNGRPGAGLLRSLLQASQYATLLPVVHPSTSSFSSNTEHLLQIGNSHLKNLYFVFMKHEKHISIMLCDVSNDFW